VPVDQTSHRAAGDLDLARSTSRRRWLVPALLLVLWLVVAAVGGPFQGRLAEVQERFHKHYSGLLERLARTGRPVLVCTIYDACPGMGRHFLRPTADPIEPAVRAEIDRHVGRVIRTMLSIFNDVIVRQATRQRMPVVELRDLLTEPEDFSDLSPIEPSARGGQKLADALVATLAGRASSPGRAGRG